MILKIILVVSLLLNAIHLGLAFADGVLSASAAKSALLVWSACIIIGALGWTIVHYLILG